MLFFFVITRAPRRRVICGPLHHDDNAEGHSVLRWQGCLSASCHWFVRDDSQHHMDTHVTVHVIKHEHTLLLRTGKDAYTLRPRLEIKVGFEGFF